jgi:tRNA A-37 threonylcarbamoyl transferase component Bud32
MGTTLAGLALWGLYVMKNKGVLDHFSRKYEHIFHKIIPPLTVGGAVCTIATSSYGLHLAVESRQPTLSFPVLGGLLGITAGLCTMCYGVYCMIVVWRTISEGKAQSSYKHLGAVQRYMREWYSRRHSPCAAEFADDALVQNDFLQQAERGEKRADRREEVDRVVEGLAVNPAAVEWHESAPFAQGGFSKVWRVTFLGEVVAAKVLPRVRGLQNVKEVEEWIHSVKREVAILHSLSVCDNIVTVLGVYIRADDAVVLMEYASGGDLRSYLDRDREAGLAQEEQLSILLDIVTGMEFCYSRTPPVHHRDLKSHNIILGSHGMWVLADFGLSKMEISATATFTASKIGTPAWASPEQLQNKHQGEPSDVWSFGVVVWEILTRQVPWEGYLPLEILAAVVTQGRRLDMLHATRHATRRPLTKLLNSCCEENPAKRPSFVGIKQQLEAVVDAYG